MSRSGYENLDQEPLVTPQERRIRRQRLWAAGIAVAIVVAILVIVLAVQLSPPPTGRQGKVEDATTTRPSTPEPLGAKTSASQPSPEQPLSTKPLASKPWFTQPSSTKPSEPKLSSTQPSEPTSSEPKPSSQQPSAQQPSLLSASYGRAAVVVDGAPCAAIGSSVLQDGGTAVDAAVATLFCNGVYNPQSMGLGGGFLMTVYSGGQVYTLNAREAAPILASPDMFANNSRAALKGSLSVAVPGELAGYWAARQRFGNKSLTWRRIIQPTIDLCRDGIPVSWTLAAVLSDYEFVANGTPADAALRNTFIDPATGRGWQEGQLYQRPALAAMLEQLAAAEESLVNLFYRGELGRLLVADVGGILSVDDLAAYSARWEEPVVLPLAPLLNLTLYSVPPPGSGAVLAAILNIIQHSDHFGEDALFYHRLVEAFKFAYAARSRLGDPRGDPDIAATVSQLVSNLTSISWGWESYSLINDSTTQTNLSVYGADFLDSGADDHGTAHVSVLAANGDAVAVTSTINQEFGSGLLSPSTGIILNDEMDDFSYAGFANDFNLAPSAANSMRPGKRPLSSMSPAIFIDPGGRARLVVGASGGSKITTATALTAVRQLWMDETVGAAVEGPRVHHQLSPNVLEYQSELDAAIVAGLAARGHVMKDSGGAGSVVGAIAVAANGRIEAAADYRKAGAVDGF